MHSTLYFWVRSDFLFVPRTLQRHTKLPLCNKKTKGRAQETQLTMSIRHPPPWYIWNQGALTEDREDGRDTTPILHDIMAGGGSGPGGGGGEQKLSVNSLLMTSRPQLDLWFIIWTKSISL